MLPIFPASYVKTTIVIPKHTAPSKKDWMVQLKNINEIVIAKINFVSRREKVAVPSILSPRTDPRSPTLSIKRLNFK